MGEAIGPRVMKLVAEHLGVDESTVKPESHFVEDLAADSLDLAEMVMKVEEEFDVSISDEEATKMMTVGSVIEFLEKHGQSGKA